MRFSICSKSDLTYNEKKDNKFNFSYARVRLIRQFLLVTPEMILQRTHAHTHAHTHARTHACSINGKL